jgi:molybdopterin-guanine dinucleotide biosynthesis protein A
MGGAKALLSLGGERIIDRIVRALAAVFADLLIVANDPGPVAGCGVPVHPDRIPGAGALGGIHAALAASPAPWTFCIACDLPFADPDLVAFLASLTPGVDAVVPRTPGGLEPLFAVYAASCLPTLEARIRAGALRADGLVGAVRTRIVEAEELRRIDPRLRSFVNVNTPEELARARRLLAERGGS